jgi:hypothetical protein
MRWQENVEQTLTEKKNASVASVNQLVQHEKKKSWPIRSQKDRECLIMILKLLYSAAVVVHCLNLRVVLIGIGVRGSKTNLFFNLANKQPTFYV